MRAELTNQEQFLFKEYDTAVWANHQIDELRNKIMVFYLFFSMLAVSGTIVFYTHQRPVLGTVTMAVLTALLMLVGFIGFLVLLVFARLRKTQLKHVYIINSVRKFFLKSNYELWTTVQFSDKTMPEPRIFSKSYFWMLMVHLVTSFVFGGMAYLVTSYFSLSGLMFVSVLLFGNGLYLELTPKYHPIEYSRSNPPFEQA
jgi:hypothetical protein